MSQEKKNHGINIAYIYLIISLASIVFIIIAYSFDKTNIKTNEYDNVKTFNEGWVYIGEDEQNNSEAESVTLPVVLESKGKGITLRAELEDITNSLDEGNKCLAIRVSHQELSVFIDGKIVEEFNVNNGTALSKTPGSTWVFADIPTGSKQVVLKYSPVYESNNEIQEILIGGKKDVCLFMIKKDAVGLIVSITMFCMSGVILLLWFFIKNQDLDNKLLFLAMFSYALSFWSLLECNSVQFLVKHQVMLNIVSYELLLLVTMPILCCVRESLTGTKRKIINFNIFMSVLNFVVCNVLQFARIADFVRTVKFTHCVMILTAFNIIFIGTGRLFIRNSNSERYRINWSKVGYIFLVLTTGMDIINFYIKLYSDGALFSRIGIFFFVLLLGVSIMKEVYRTTLITEKMEIWDQYAHQDILTNTNNRVAFEDELQDIIRDKSDDLKVAVISFDVNNLKTINDTYGHSAGDEYLKECISAINDVIGESAKLFRIGGDEFVVIVRPYGPGQVMKYISEFESVLRNENKKYKYPISFAYGYAYFKPQLDGDIYDTVKRADKDMYNKKVEMKRQGMDVRL